MHVWLPQLFAASVAVGDDGDKVIDSDDAGEEETNIRSIYDAKE